MMMVEFIKNLQLFTSLNSGIDMKPKWEQMNTSGFGMKGSQPLRVVHAFIETAARYMKERSRTDLYN